MGIIRSMIQDQHPLAVVGLFYSAGDPTKRVSREHVRYHHGTMKAHEASSWNREGVIMGETAKERDHGATDRRD